VVALILLVAIVGPQLSPYQYDRQDYLAIDQAPSWSHPLGTDSLGRDYLTRLMVGGRTALLLSFWVVVVTNVVAISLGAICGYVGGWVDALVMRLGDVFMAFPHLLLALFIAGTVRPAVSAWLGGFRLIQENAYLIDYVIVFGALAVVNWTGVARLARVQVQALRHQEFVTAAEASGASPRHVIWSHLVPNSLAPLVVAASGQIAGVMVLESALSFFGIGIRPPAASWGGMIGENLTSWQNAPHLMIVPGVTLAVAALAFNFIGDGLNDALDPRGSR
jgi:ABC-type dipeptide/oligopeptide/nickel transport system permease subunit